MDKPSSSLALSKLQVDVQVLLVMRERYLIPRISLHAFSQKLLLELLQFY